MEDGTEFVVEHGDQQVAGNDSVNAEPIVSFPASTNAGTGVPPAPIPISPVNQNLQNEALNTAETDGVVAYPLLTPDISKMTPPPPPEIDTSRTHDQTQGEDQEGGNAE